MLREINVTQEKLITAVVKVYSDLGTYDRCLDFIAEVIDDNPTDIVNLTSEIKEYVRQHIAVRTVVMSITATDLISGETTEIYTRPKKVRA